MQYNNKSSHTKGEELRHAMWWTRETWAVGEKNVDKERVVVPWVLTEYIKRNRKGAEWEAQGAGAHIMKL